MAAEETENPEPFTVTLVIPVVDPMFGNTASMFGKSTNRLSNSLDWVLMALPRL